MIPHPFRVVADLREQTGYLIVAAPYAGAIVGKTKTILEQRVAIFDCGRNVERTQLSDARLLSVAAVLRFQHPEVFAQIYALMFDRGDFAAVVAPASVRLKRAKQYVVERPYNPADDAPIRAAIENACASALIHDTWRPEVRYFADWQDGAEWSFSSDDPFASAPVPSLPEHVWKSLHALDILYRLGACKNGNRLAVPTHEWPRNAWALPVQERLS